MLDEVHGLALPIVETAGLAFERGATEPETVVLADRRRVIQVVLNLVGNAAKYNRTGSLVRLVCTIENQAVKVKVEDDGPGVASDMVDRLFTPFDRLGQQDRARVEGPGLGLSLSKSLVEAMGGQISYEAMEQGSCFWFSLMQPSRPAAPALASQTASNEGKPCQPN